MIASLAPSLRRLSDWRRRRRRARKRLHMLREADLVILSLGKSGRTWLRAMISNLYHQRHGVPENRLIRFDDFHQYDPAIPKILLTHDDPCDPWHQRRPWRQLGPAGKEPFRGKRVLAFPNCSLRPLDCQNLPTRPQPQHPIAFTRLDAVGYNRIIEGFFSSLLDH